MKPDFVVIEKRLNRIFTYSYDELPLDDLSYMYFFPKVEKQVIDTFAEFGLHVEYKGKTRPIFPSNIMWGKESFASLGQKSKTGELEIIETETRNKVGTMTVSFTYDGSLKLIEPPQFTIERI